MMYQPWHRASSPLAPEGRLVDIDCSEEGWDLGMMKYALVYEHRGAKHSYTTAMTLMRPAFGYAVRTEDDRARQ